LPGINTLFIPITKMMLPMQIKLRLESTGFDSTIAFLTSNFFATGMPCIAAFPSTSRKRAMVLEALPSLPD
jgi:hypothetical protein